ncbi:tetratricopeptide repeat protein [Azospirillum sp. INR13]|uniref:tetratricopeptide repeat protein n=1 Tax=Azospirillum sp. INR13 TaxID=2596919 RepID=UPI001892879D|nr:tetratricopeptide repeat protein [Azospirillum sp. INR13]MBF5094096.1 tetratricopeptide repeat protein [Azospirillum sp. INR13]
MRANILVVLLVLLAGIGASLLLIPRGAELALQKFRDRDYDSARAVYEERYAAGERGGATVMPLTRLSLAQGDVERAIALTEEFVAAEPSSIEARELLNRLFQDAQRPGDYLENLTVLAELRHSADLYRELAYAAGFRNRMVLKADALARYCALAPEDVEAQQELAALLAARGDHAGAVDRLLRADDRARGNIGADSRELLMSLLIDLGRAEDAFGRARRWLGERPTIAAMIGLASQLAAASRPDLGLRLLEPQVIGPQVTGQKPPLALELTYIDLLIAADRREEARTRLSALSGPVEDSQFGRLLALEMSAGQAQEALRAAKGRDLRLAPGWVLAGLAETALRDGDRPFLDRLHRELGEGFLTDYPVLAANIALGRGDADAAARWAERGLAGSALTLGDRLAAIRILDRAGRRDAAAAAFDRLVLSDSLPDDQLSDGQLSDGQLPDDQLEELAVLYIDLDRAPAGLDWFVARRQGKPSPAADHGWARLAAKAGDPVAVADWLATRPVLPAALLQDIAGSAAERAVTDRRAAPLALAAAQRAFALDPSPRSRLAVAAALTATGKPAAALPLLAPLLDQGGAEVEAALHRGARRCRPVGGTGPPSHRQAGEGRPDRCGGAGHRLPAARPQGLPRRAAAAAGAGGTAGRRLAGGLCRCRRQGERAARPCCLAATAGRRRAAGGGGGFALSRHAGDAGPQGGAAPLPAGPRQRRPPAGGSAARTGLCPAGARRQGGRNASFAAAGGRAGAAERGFQAAGLSLGSAPAAGCAGLAGSAGQGAGRPGGTGGMVRPSGRTRRRGPRRRRSRDGSRSAGSAGAEGALYRGAGVGRQGQGTGRRRPRRPARGNRARPLAALCPPRRTDRPARCRRGSLDGSAGADAGRCRRVAPAGHAGL